MRDHSVTIAKAIAIIFIVIGHTGCPQILDRWVTPVGLAVFFFMSGYCFKEKYLDDAKTFARRRIVGIYWPSLKWSLLFLLLHNVFYHLNIYSDEYGFQGRTSVLYTASDFLHNIVYVATKMQAYEQLLGGYWFLKSLFVGSFIFYLTARCLNRHWCGVLLLLSVTMTLSVLDVYIPYFYIGSREFFAASVIYIGSLYKQRRWTWHRWTAVNVVALVLVVVGSEFWHTKMFYYEYWMVPPHTLSVTLAVLSLLHLGEWISKRADNSLVRLFMYIGDHTMEVLTWHFLSFKLVTLLLIAIYALPAKQLSEFPAIGVYAVRGWWILYLCAGVGIPILGTYLCQRVKDSINVLMQR